MPRTKEKGPRCGPPRAFIEKLYTFPEESQRPTKLGFERNNTELQSVIDDGGLSAAWCKNGDFPQAERDGVLYSLNKRKRWTLPSRLEEALDDELSEGDFAVSCVVRAANPRPRGRPVVISLATRSGGVGVPASTERSVSMKSVKVNGKRAGKYAHLSDCVIRSKLLEEDFQDENFESADSRKGKLSTVLNKFN